MKIIWGVAFLLLAGCAAVDQPMNVGEVLGTGIKTMEAPVPSCASSPTGALADGAVKIRPGETVCIQLQIREGSIVPVAVATDADKANTIVFRAWRETGAPDTFLSIHNPLNTPVRYRARIRRTADSRWENGQGFTFFPAGLVTLNWSFPVDEINLGDLGFLTKSQVTECRRRIAAGLELSSECALLKESNGESVSMEKSDGPAPVCESGHEGALANGTVTVRPGETICVRLEARGAGLMPTGIVTTATPGNTLILKAEQPPGTAETALHLYSFLDRPLRYEASLVRAGSNDAEYTSSCPVALNGKATEYWPYAVRTLSLKNFRLLPPSAPYVCR